MFSPDLAIAIDASTPPGLTHIGIVLKKSDDAVLVTEPSGHPYGVSATFNKVKLQNDERPSAALARCLQEQANDQIESVYPIPTAWATSNSRSFYFAGLFDSLPSIGQHRVSWMQPDEAHRRISASKGAESRQRDLGLLAAATEICVSPYRRILLMVRELHHMGYEQMRAAPYLYPIAWRCPVVPAAWTWREHGGLFDNMIELMPEPGGQGQRLTYSSGDRQRPFGWEDLHFTSPKKLAERFIKTFPQVASMAWGPDESYVSWFEDMLRLTGPNGLVYAQGEYQPPLPDMLYATHCQVERVAAPPPGLMEQHAWARFKKRLDRANGDQ
jgi:hypothetical protein